MPDYQYITIFTNRHDSTPQKFILQNTQFDCMTDLRFGKYSSQFDGRPLQLLKKSTFFSSDSYRGLNQTNCNYDIRIEQYLTLPQFFNAVGYRGLNQINNNYDIRIEQYLKLPQLFNAVAYRSGEQICWQNDWRIYQKNCIAQLWDCIDLWATPKITKLCLNTDLIIANKSCCPASFNIVSICPSSKIIFCYDFLHLIREMLSNRFNAIPCDYLSKYFLSWNSNKKEFATLPIAHQSLVRSGWKIIARNILTGEKQELGFIDTENQDKDLIDIFLPNGDYEISVLTSSLFWQDCFERVVRTITIRDNVEVSSLPVIYNLRSSVSQTVTTISWSANQSEVADCVFGVWYSNESPVNTNRPPDKTVWYFPTQTEYQTTLQQHEKLFTVVASMRTGNESELGNIQELLLDWTTIPPHAPDDVVVFDMPLRAVDGDVLSRPYYEDDFILWQ
jgi:hypothetical protein